MNPPTLEEIRELALDVFRPEAIDSWLQASNSLLDWHTPLDLIERGQSDRVAALLNALAEGAVL